MLADIDAEFFADGLGQAVGHVLRVVAFLDELAGAGIQLCDAGGGALKQVRGAHHRLRLGAAFQFHLHRCAAQGGRIVRAFLLQGQVHGLYRWRWLRAGTGLGILCHG